MYLAKISPRGFAGGMREYSEKFHKIFSWENHPDNYENILINLITFIMVNTMKIFQLFVNCLM